eukprot:s685_g12.t1
MLRCRRWRLQLRAPLLRGAKRILCLDWALSSNQSSVVNHPSVITAAASLGRAKTQFTPGKSQDGWRAADPAQAKTFVEPARIVKPRWPPVGSKDPEKGRGWMGKKDQVDVYRFTGQLIPRRDRERKGLQASLLSWEEWPAKEETRSRWH